LKANHNKDYSVVKTCKAAQVAFFSFYIYLIFGGYENNRSPPPMQQFSVNYFSYDYWLISAD